MSSTCPYCNQIIGFGWPVNNNCCVQPIIGINEDDEALVEKLIKEKAAPLVYRKTYTSADIQALREKVVRLDAISGNFCGYDIYGYINCDEVLSLIDEMIKEGE